MQVYKFGGASIATPERMKALLPIVQEAQQPLVVIVSALGKTTNALEAVLNARLDHDVETAMQLLKNLQTEHHQYVHELLQGEQLVACNQKLDLYFQQIENILLSKESNKKDYLYDQLVSVGELLSTTIFSNFLQAHTVENTWLDARQMIITNDYFRQAVVEETVTEQLVQKLVKPVLNEGKICITQGYIGGTSDGKSTTLGREGSDYSAALLAAMLNADSVTIWKDVPGFLNADPRKFKDAVRIPEISYYEVIELAYYGAQIIHPKTIKPLQNKEIPLYVKCFLDPQADGTLIRKKLGSGMNYPPLIVHKDHQMLMKVTTKDFSFITEENLSTLYEIYARHRIKINMIQNAAISFVACIDHKHFAKDALIEELKINYDVKINDQCTLLTVRHYKDEEKVEHLVQDKKVLLRQRSRRVYQILYKEN